VARHLAARGLPDLSEWIWSEYTGNETAQKFFDNLYNNPPPAKPTTW
jgi:hypothetical protein